jgi:hypothetical protein
MRSYTREILACVKEIQEHVAYKKYEEVLRGTLHQCIMALIQCDERMRKPPEQAAPRSDAPNHD